MQLLKCFTDFSQCSSCTSVESTEPYKKFTNCRVVADGKITAKDVWVQGNRIVEPPTIPVFKNVLKIDCGGNILAPGYIDIHIKGAFGVDFCNDLLSIDDGRTLRKGILEVAGFLLSTGVTSFCPTFSSCARNVAQESIQVVHELIDEKMDSPRARIIGAHMEGPFITVAGSHNGALMKQPKDGISDVMAAYGTLEGVKIVTVAPELPGIYDIIKDLREFGIVVAAGHTKSTTEEAIVGYNAGVRMITHLYNAMQHHHREPGLYGLLPDANSDLFYTIIADNVHTHPRSIYNAWKVHPDGLILISDGILVMGMPPGEYMDQGVLVEVYDNVVVMKGTRTLRGSVATLDECVRNFQKFTGCSAVEAIEVATLHPAKLLKIEHERGVIHPGAYADLILLDDELNVLKCYVDGEFAWDSESGKV